jgi:hypothetical protein
MIYRAFAITLTFPSSGVIGEIAAQAPPHPRDATTLFQNVRIFDGRSDVLSAPSNVLVKGNVIEHISITPVAVGNPLDNINLIADPTNNLKIIMKG